MVAEPSYQLSLPNRNCIASDMTKVWYNTQVTVHQFLKDYLQSFWEMGRQDGLMESDHVTQTNLAWLFSPTHTINKIKKHDNTQNGCGT